MRSLSAALASNYWPNHVVYWVGPFLGASLCGLLYMAFFWPAGQAADKREDQQAGGPPAIRASA
jgi:hypothetical protein